MTRTDELKQALDELDQKTNIEWRSEKEDLARISFDGNSEAALKKILDVGWVVTETRSIQNPKYKEQVWVEPVTAQEREKTEVCPKCGGSGKITEEKLSLEVQ